MPHQPCTGALRANSLRDVHLRTAPAGRTSVSGVISLGSNGPPASVAETYWISSQAQLKGTGRVARGRAWISAETVAPEFEARYLEQEHFYGLEKNSPRIRYADRSSLLREAALLANILSYFSSISF